MTVTVAVIPVHNEAVTILGIVTATLDHVDRVIVIDDGSTDGTCELLTGSGARVIRNSVNVGKGQRLVEGLQYAFGEGAQRVVTLDGDGQHDPADIPKFLACADADPGAIILGDRSGETRNMPLLRAFGNRFGSFFIGWACARKLRDAQCGMRLYPLGMWHDITVPATEIDGFLFETAVLLHASEAGFPFVTVPIAARYQGFVHRPSHFQPLNDFFKIAAMVMRFLMKRRLRLRGLLVSLQLAKESSGGTKDGAEACKK